MEILDRPTGVVNRSMGDVHPLGNPHYWLDPANAVRIAIQIRNRLAQLRPADAAYFDQRLNAFKLRINDANKRWLARWRRTRARRSSRTTTPGRTSRRHFGLNVVGYVEPKPGMPPSPSHTLELINLMKAQKVKVILMEPYFDQQDAAVDRGADRSESRRAVPVRRRQAPASTTTSRLFDCDIANLVKALK